MSEGCVSRRCAEAACEGTGMAVRVSEGYAGRAVFCVE